jgi:hypothetical protein
MGYASIFIEFDIVVTRLRVEIELEQLKKPDPQMDGKRQVSQTDPPPTEQTVSGTHETNSKTK